MLACAVARAEEAVIKSSSSDVLIIMGLFGAARYRNWRIPGAVTGQWEGGFRRGCQASVVDCGKDGSAKGN